MVTVGTPANAKNKITQKSQHSPFLVAKPWGMIKRFNIPYVTTVSSLASRGKKKDYKKQVLNISGLKNSILAKNKYIFVVTAYIGPKHGTPPDTENIAKVIVDAFTGTLFPDDNSIFVPGVCSWVEYCDSLPKKDEHTTVSIYRMVA